MTPVDIEECLRSMTIVVDSNEQPSERAQRRYDSFSVPYRIQKLDYGDYTFDFTLPDESNYFNSSDHRIYPDCVIERKADLTELSGNLCQNRERFEAEFKRAKEKGCSIYLLVEDANWEKLITGKYGTRFHPNAYEAALLSIIVRYDIKLIFCKKEISGRMIHDILYRELKARLERGDFG